MFTGIITNLGTLKQYAVDTATARATIATKTPFNNLTLGESIAVNGICLTVTNITNQCFQVDISSETLNKTTAKQWQTNMQLNLERAATINTFLGGHLVTGHIDTTATIVEIVNKENFKNILLKIPRQFTKYFIDKGSITIDGVSITVNSIAKNIISIFVIPHTLQASNLNNLVVGSKTNIEIDQIAKYVAKMLATSN